MTIIGGRKICQNKNILLVSVFQHQAGGGDGVMDIGRNAGIELTDHINGTIWSDVGLRPTDVKLLVHRETILSCNSFTASIIADGGGIRQSLIRPFQCNRDFFTYAGGGC